MHFKHGYFQISFLTVDSTIPKDPERPWDSGKIPRDPLSPGVTARDVPPMIVDFWLIVGCFLHRKTGRDLP